MGLTLVIRGAILALSLVLLAISSAGICMAQSVALPRAVADRGSGTAVEYFHQGFGHYFVTAFQSEAASLDSNPGSGWARTGNSFPVEQDVRSGLQPVCRFFTEAFSPKSSHFYTPYSAECGIVKADKTWQ